MEVGDVIPGQEEAQGDEQTAGGHEGDHVGHPGHDRALQAPSPVLGALLALLGGLAAGRHAGGARVVDGGQGLVHQGAGVVDGGLDADVDDGLAGEALAALDGQVVGEDDGAGPLDELGVEGVDLARALALDGHGDAAVLAGLLQGLGGHEGVGDAGGAGGDPHDDGLALRRGRRRRSGLGLRGTGPWCRVRGASGLTGRVGLALLPAVEQLGLDLLRDDPGDLLGVGGLAQGVGELGLHETAGELGQELEVEVVGAVGGGDHEDEVGGLPVGGPEVDRLRQAGEAEAGGQDVRAAAVRDGDAAGDPGGGGGLALLGVGGQAVGAGGPAGAGHGGGQELDDVFLARAGVGVERDQLGDDEGLVLGHGLPWCPRCRRPVGCGGSQVVKGGGRRSCGR